MKAAQYRQYGGPGVIEVTSDAPMPTPGSGQVLVKVYAASLNPIDWKIRQGYMKDHVPLQFPVTIGSNISGVISQIGEDVTDFAVGDEVYGQAMVLNRSSGAIAEFATANAANIAKKPTSVNHVEAAALPLVGVSALQALDEHIGLEKQHKIVIHGGSGGIGSMAIQLAKAKGAHVATTASNDSKDFVYDLGADVFVDYKNEKFEDRLTGYDAVFDTVGGETTDKSFQVLKKGGKLVSMAGKPSQDMAQKHGVLAIGQGTNTSHENLVKLAQLVDNGTLKIHIAKVFPIEQTKEAFDYLENAHPKGKVVITIE